MTVQVLGGIALGAAGEPVRVANIRLQRIVAALALAGPAGLSVQRLAARVWDEGEDPASPVPTLRTYIKRLREAAGDPDGALLVTRPGGYALDIDDDGVDARRFTRLVRQAGGDTDPDAALQALEQALALWGPPFIGLEHLDWVAGEVALLEEAHLSAAEQRLCLLLDLAAGTGEGVLAGARAAAGDVAGAAAALLVTHPYAEHVVALQALALYRAGRQADALAAIAAHRRRMAADLGVDMSTEVRDLEVAILRQDPALAGALVSGRRLRGYRLGPRIGSGAYSVVHRASQPSVNRDVAIKVIRRELAGVPAFVARFATEAQTVARLAHPYIVPLYDYWREADQAYLVMRWVEGGTLEDAVSQGPLPLDEVVAVVGEVAQALDFAHRRGVVHRDVKPSNVLRDAEGHAYLTDFGIALVDSPDDDVPLLRSVGSPTFASPEQFDGGPIGPATDVYSLGLLAHVLVTGRVPWPDATDTLALSERHHRAALPPVHTGDPDVDAGLGRVFARATAKSPSERYPSAGALADALATVASMAPVPLSVDVVNPYRGLDAFGEPDRDVFHGRDALISAVVDRLDEQLGLLLVGPSGCGKSSLVHAGVVPRLRAAPGDTVVATMVPGADPFAALTQAIDMVATAPGVDVAGLVRRGMPLARVVELAAPGGRLVLVVDQLEELFTSSAPEVAERFLALLAQAMVDEGAWCRVLLTLRADFFDHPLDSPSMGPLVGRMLQTVRPMEPGELVAAVVEPARSVGVSFSEACVARVVADVAGEPGSLPLLQFALTRMFDQRASDRIDVADYDRVGGLAGALVGAAEEQFGQMPAEQQQAVRRLMSRLVAVDEEVTRRRELLAEVTSMPGVSRELVDALVGARLLTLDRQPTSREPTVELVHEALLGAWPRLGGWVAESRVRLAAAAKLRADATAWQASGHDPAMLPRGRALATAEDLLADPDVGVGAPVPEFVSQAMVVREAQASEERRRLEAERRQDRRRRGLLAGTAVAATLGLVATGLGWSAARRASAEREAAAYTELIGTSQSMQGTRTDLALLLAAEAYAQDPTPQAQGALLGGLRQLEGTVEVWADARFGIGTSQGSCVTSPEPGVLVLQPNPFNQAGGPVPGGELIEVDLAAQQVLRRIADQRLVCEVHRLPEGAPLPTGAGGAEALYAGETKDGAMVVIDETGTEVVRMPRRSRPIWLADGTLIARGGSSDYSDPSRPPSATAFFAVDLDEGAFTGEALFAAQEVWRSPRGTQLVISGPQGRDAFGAAPVDLIDGDTLERIARLGDLVPASPPAWNRDESLVAMADQRGALTVWSATDGEEVLTLPDVQANLVAISPDGGELAYSTGTGLIGYRSLPDGQRIEEIDPGQQVLMRMEWVGDDHLAVVGAGGVVSLLSRADGGLGERTAECCAPVEFSFVVADGEPNPYAYYGAYETGQGRFVDLVTGETAQVDMARWVLDPWAAEGRLPTREALLLKPGGTMLLVDPEGELIAETTWPVDHIWDGDVPQMALLGEQGAPTDFALLGVAEGSPGATTAIELARVDAAALETVSGPSRIDLPEPASYVRLRDGGTVAIEYKEQDGTRYEFRDTEGTLLSEVSPPTPVGWAALTGDGRHVVAARSSDDSVRVIDTQSGEASVLPINSEPEGPTMLSDGRFMIQTREGQFELWDAAGPTQVGVLADPGPYAFTSPHVPADESAVWIILDGAWTRIPIDPREWLARACSLAGRALTQQEWQDFVPGDRPYRDACAEAA